MNTGIAAMEAEARQIVLEADISTSPETADTAEASDRPVSSDNAQLSEAARNREITPEQRLKFLLNWTLEQLGAEWLLLLNFMPVPGDDPAMLLEKLYALYHFLQGEILNNTAGPATQREMTRLEQAFSAALNRVWEYSMKDLTSFFENFGTTSQLEWLKSGTHYLASGERLTPKELDKFWKAGQDFQKGADNTKPGGNAAGGGSSYQAFTQKGALYQPRGREITFIPHQEVPLSGQTAGSVKESQQIRKMSFRNPEGDLKAGVSRQAVNGSAILSPEKQGLFSAGDLQKADSFVKYIVKEGNVFSHPYFNSSNEELLGVLSAVTALKGREFCQAGKLGTAMGKELLAAADGYIEKAIKQSSMRLQEDRKQSTLQEDRKQSALQQDGKQSALQQKEVYKTYYYTMDQYRKYGKSDMAILEGLKYAVEVFQEKKLNTLFSQNKRYGKEAEFFHSGAVDVQGQQERLAADLRQGTVILERDWRSFLRFLGKSHEKMVSFAAMMRPQRSLRPLGTVLNQSKPDEEENTKNYRLFLICSLAVFLACIFVAWIIFY